MKHIAITEVSDFENGFGSPAEFCKSSFCRVDDLKKFESYSKIDHVVFEIHHNSYMILKSSNSKWHRGDIIVHFECLLEH